MTDSRCSSFQQLEQGIATVSRKMPGAPREEIILTRLHWYVQLQLSAWFETALKPYGLNETTWMALMLLYSRPEERMNPSEISAAMAFSRTNATRVVDELAGKGWVQRLPCPGDRRKTELALTAAGLALIKQVMPVQRQRLREAWQDFTAEERSQLEALQHKLLTRLQDE